MISIVMTILRRGTRALGVLWSDMKQANRESETFLITVKRTTIRVFKARHLVLIQREDKVDAKGIGDVTTYWVKTTSSQQGSQGPGSSNGDNESVVSSGYGTDTDMDDSGPVGMTKKKESLNRLVQWNCDLLTRQIKIILTRQAGQVGSSESSQLTSDVPPFHPDSVQPRNEYARVIHLPRFDAKSVARQIPANEVYLEDAVKVQLLDFAKIIGTSNIGAYWRFLNNRHFARGERPNFSFEIFVYSSGASYHQNPFHNWEVRRQLFGLRLSRAHLSYLTTCSL
jgi:hypothetical protein